ncbi:MAG: trehalose-phosphatase [Acidimicrobiales bacterium]
MRLPGVLEPIAARPGESAVFLDFDGTLSPIVEDPALARPLQGVPELLMELGSLFAVVAVVSGRPAAFLAEHLGRPGGVRLIGLYGLEEAGKPAGPTVDPDALERWRPIMAGLADLAEHDAPPGVSVERKPLAFTLHFRSAPDHAVWAERFAEDQRERLGVVVQPGRMAVELRPGIETDKGTVVGALSEGCAAACCFGDDLGDIPAFDALGRLADGGVTVARVAVRDPESPTALVERAELAVDGPLGALEILGALLAVARGGSS